VVLCYEKEMVADHKRSWGKQGVFFNAVSKGQLKIAEGGGRNVQHLLHD
jgi:hypothetical protein